MYIFESVDYDYVIIGSGFGGSVSAYRLSQKGYKVLVIEKGKWFSSEDFPKTNWNLRKWIWLPKLKFFGIMKLTYFRNIGILSGVGVGGGSLVYANTLPTPKNKFYTSGSWAGLTNWKDELAPHYSNALRMLGAAKNPRLFDSDIQMQNLAKELKIEHEFEATDVAVYFGEENKTVSDPFFDGDGPERTGCNFCGQCMTGCRNNSKNTLDKNYLHLAQKLGCEIIAEHEVKDVIPKTSGGYNVTFKRSTRNFSKKKTISTKGVIFSGGVLGTVNLLLKLKSKSLPKLSNKLGHDVRTNNEALIFNVTTNKITDYSKGVAIGSIIHVDENSHLEPVRYGRGSGFWRILMLPMVTEKNFILRILKLMITPFKKPLKWFKIWTVKDFAKSSSIHLFMQDLDSTITFKRKWFGMGSKYNGKTPPSAFIPEAHDIARKHAKMNDSEPVVIVSETITGIPSTAHILGGCVMGKDASEGVIDSSNRVFGYDNMYICDGSMISANPGVNPSLSITAITERAMSLITERAMSLIPDKSN